MRIRALTSSFLLASFLVFPAAVGAQSNPEVGSSTPDFVGRYTASVQEVVNEGMRNLGIRYRFGGTSPETGLDCSGLVQSAFRNALGLNLPRTAREMAQHGDKVSRQELKPGDLVFFNTMRRAFSHVGIYLGDGQFLHSTSSGGNVRVDNMSSRYWANRFNGARRLVDSSSADSSTHPALPN